MSMSGHFCHARICRLLGFAWLGVLLCLTGLRVQCGELDVAMPRHWVVAIDTSFSMNRIREATRLACSNWVASGFSGHLAPGDLLELWAFQEQINTRPTAPQVWMPELNLAIARGSTAFLQRTRFDGQTHPQKVISSLVSTAAQSPHLTAILVSDGDDPVRGTPFDSALNIRLQQLRKLAHAQRRPIFLCLKAEAGRWTGWSAELDPADLELPPPPVPPVRPKPVPVVQPTLEVPAPRLPPQPEPTTPVRITVQTPPPVIPSPEPPPVIKPVVLPVAVLTPPAIETPPVAIREPATKHANPPGVQVETPPARPASSVPAPASTPSSPPRIVPVAPPITTAGSKPAPIEASRAVEEPVLIRSTPEIPAPPKPAMRTGEAKRAPPVAVVPVSGAVPEVSSAQGRFLLAGAILLGVAGLGVYLLLQARPNRHHPSLISQSLEPGKQPGGNDPPPSRDPKA